MKKKIKQLWSKVLLYYYSVLMNKNLLRQNCKVNGLCRFNGLEDFGANCNFNGCSIYGSGKVIFGHNFHSGKNLNILTSYHNYNGTSIPYDSSIITKNIQIGNNVWIGMNVTILGGVTIGEGAIIQAGSVVSSNVEPLSIVGGNPARKFKSRDSKHYFDRKNSNSFF